MTDAQTLYEALYFLPRGPQRHALEMVIDRAARYEAALQGIASCATQCGCCEMHSRVARKTLDGEYASCP